MSYKHIKPDERIVITTLLDECSSQAYIAKRIGVSQSAISREISRNSLKSKPKLKSKSKRKVRLPAKPLVMNYDCRKDRGNGAAQYKYEASCIYKKQQREAVLDNRSYSSKVANKKQMTRRSNANKLRAKLVHDSGSFVELYCKNNLLKNQWSPEQISGRLVKDYGIKISFKTIYRYVYASPDKKKLASNLRHGNNRYRRKHGTPQRIKNQQRNLPSIHDRENVIEQRTRLYDYEGDTVVGLDKKDRLLTHVDRACGMCDINLILNFNAQKIARITIAKLTKALTITYDRGVEFASYDMIKTRTKAEVFFADAYSSYQRGSNENLNGLVRQYFPKRYDFKLITKRQVERVERKLNNRPRKRYDYCTPLEQEAYLASL